MKSVILAVNFLLLVFAELSVSRTPLTPTTTSESWSSSTQTKRPSKNINVSFRTSQRSNISSTIVRTTADRHISTGTAIGGQTTMRDTQPTTPTTAAATTTTTTIKLTSTKPRVEPTLSRAISKKPTTHKTITTTLDPVGDERILELIQEGLGLFAKGKTLQEIMKILAPDFTSTLEPLVQDIVTKGMPLFMGGVSGKLFHVMLSDFTKLFAKTDAMALVQRVATMLVDKFVEPSLVHIPNVTLECLGSLDSFLHGVINLDEWALYMLDAMGKPAPGLVKGNIMWLGNKDECEATRFVVRNKTVVMGKIFGNKTVVFQGQYTNVFIRAPEQLVLKLTGGETIPQGFQLQFDICLPDYCSSDEIKILTQDIAGLVGGTINSVHTLKSHDPISEDNNAIIAICILAVIEFFTICAVIYSIITYYKRQKLDDYVVTNVNGNVYVNDAVTNDDGDTKDKKSEYEAERQRFSTFTEEEPGTLAKLLLSFSFPRNLEKTLDTSQKSGSIDCLHGIRVLSMGYVILGNTCYFLFNNDVFVNGVDILHDLKTFMLQPVINATLATDSFFLLSGTLLSYWFLRDTKRRGGLSFKQMVLYYTHRIWRLTPIYALILMMYYCLFSYSLDGPIDVKDSPDIVNCGESWWTNLLYINNFYKTDKPCMVWTWYSACDMQFYVIAPVILIPLVLSKVVGIVFIFALILVHVICAGIMEYKYGGNIMHPGSIDSGYFQEVFIKPYTRVAPFAIGLLLGYIVQNKHKYRMNRIAAVIGWILTFGLTAVWTTITYNDNKDFPRNWTIMGQTFYEVFSRPVWALGLAWVIYACVKGYGGPINSVLSWRGWLPLSRVTYVAYLGHPLVLIIQYFNTRALFYFNTQTLMFNYASTLLLTYGFGLFVYVFLEAPWRCLEEVFFPVSKETTNEDSEVPMGNGKSVLLELKE